MIYEWGYGNVLTSTEGYTRGSTIHIACPAPSPTVNRRVRRIRILHSLKSNRRNSKYHTKKFEPYDQYIYDFIFNKGR